VAVVTPERIAQVHADVTDVVVRMSEGSILPAPEQNRMLAQACTEVCGLLRDWLANDDWARMRPRASARVADTVPGRQDYARFLDQMLADALTRASQAAGAPSLAESLVDEARAAVERISRRRFLWTQQELFDAADSRVRKLRTEVCKLAFDLGDEAAEDRTREDRRLRARKVLQRTLGLLPALTLAMASVSPPQMEANLSAWGHDAVRVVTIYLIAEQAEPDALIEPPQLSGPEIEPEPELEL
jgi:hypothetical protein